MDPSIIGNVDSLYALLGLGIVAITVLTLDKRRRQDRVPQAQAASETEPNGATNNGHPVSANYVKRVVAEHARDCNRLDRVEKRLDEIYTMLAERLPR